MDDKRQRILQATLALIDEKGLQSTPMSAIAKRSGVAMGTIYHHFTNKEELVAILFQELNTRLGEYALLNYAAEAPVRTRFRQIWTNMVNFSLQNRQEFLFLDHFAYSPYIAPAAKTDAVGWEQTLEQIFRDGQAQDIIKPLDPAVLLQMTLGMLIMLIKGDIAGKFILTDEVIATAVDMCWDAVKR